MDDIPQDVPPAATGVYDERLQLILGQIAGQVEFDLACIYVPRDGSSGVRVAAGIGLETLAEADRTALFRWLDGPSDDLSPRKATLDASAGLSALLLPFPILDVTPGGLVLLYRDDIPDLDTICDALAPQLALAQTVAEHLRLVSRRVTSEALAATARAIVQDPSPRAVVHALQENLFDEHVIACIMAVYGPRDGEGSNGGYEYVEIAGTWTQFLGSDVGIGLRFDLDSFPRLLETGEEGLIFEGEALAEEMSVLSPEVNDMYDRSGVRGLAILPLRSDRRKLGVLIVCTDGTYAFSPHQLRMYRFVCEFLTITAFAEVLQQQKDLVQQGRTAVLDAVKDGVLMVQPDAQAAVLTANNQFLAMFGLEDDALAQTTLWDLLEAMRIPADIRRGLMETWREIGPEDTAVQEGEFRVTSPRGIPADVQWRSAPVFQEGHVVGRIYVFYDVTPERAGERLRTELLSRISHELRTPLTSIRGFAEFILEVSGGELPDIAREYTEIILRSAKHLNALFTDVIEFTRANAGEISLYLTEASVLDIVLEVVARLELQYKEKGQSVVMDLSDDIPQIHLDVDRLNQVLTNLMTNAIKYGPDNSTIKIGARYVESERDLPRKSPPDVTLPCVLFNVEDGGKGLTAEDADMVFLPFYRTRAARASMVTGAGLGLAVSQILVELHHGKIWVEPATKRKPGGRFYFTISARLD